ASQGFLTLSTLAPLEQGFNDFYLTQDLLTPSAARGVVVTGTLSIANSLNVASAAVKTLIVWGANDAVVDKGAGDYLHSAIPGSQLVVFPNTGHLVQIEKPVAFNLLLYSFANGL
ncbi:MAG: alpha/beta fold hydrolase, partial [Candidatus Berkiella sp.]